MDTTSSNNRPMTARRRRLRRALLISTVIVVAHLIGFATSLHALMATRTAQGSVAWMVSLNAMPYVAVPAYWIFGRSRFQGYFSLRRDAISLLEYSLEDELISLQPFRTDWPDEDRRLRTIETLARLPSTDGNQVELLIDGEDTFTSMFAGIDSAQDYLLVQFYIIKHDAQGVELKRRLIERADAGVRVYLLFDEIGSLNLPRSYIDELTDAGVEVRAFTSNRGWANKFQLNFRNHRKLLVADGRSAWMGGINIGSEYRSDDWRDTHLRIEGPAALNLQLSFLEDWRWASDDMLEVSWQPHAVTGADVSILILPTGPIDTFETASLAIQQIANLANERLWLASPYFVPDEGVIASLKLAAVGGVDVRVLLPEVSDNILTTLAAYTFFDSLIEAGVKIYQYQPGLMHGKFFLFDNRGAAVSSVNLDNRSLRLNFELTALVIDPDFTRQVADMFEDDFAQSHKLPANVFADKPFWFRVAARGAHLFAPVL